MRNLATIQIIDKLTPIDGADKIEVAHVLGWECVVKKGEFKEGEKIIYCEVDSVLPDKPEFEFLRERKFRIRTIKLRGQISQGLILPAFAHLQKHYDVGTDVTEKLGITKYLTPSEREEIEHETRKDMQLKKFMMRYSWFRKIWRRYVLGHKPLRRWPFWCHHTDEPRLQIIPHVIEQFKDHTVYVTEKIDYQSVTFTGKIIPKFSGILGKLIPIKKYQFVVCSRNVTNNNKNSLYWEIAKKYNIEKILRENPTLTIQGEQGDPKVQGNKYGIKEPQLWVFNIIDHEKNYHYDYTEMYNFCKAYNLEVVPLITLISEFSSIHRPEFKLSEIGSTVQEFVEFSKGKSVYADIPREGIVVRCIKNGKKLLSFKVINPEFLLKYDN